MLSPRVYLQLTRVKSKMKLETGVDPKKWEKNHDGWRYS